MMNYALLQPALRWEDAIPTGNGTVGVLVHGHIAQESIVINHDRCWLEKSRPELPDLAHLLPEVRRLQAEGRWAEAAKVYPAALKTANYHCAVADYHPLGELWLNHPDIGATSGWKSALDHDTGEIVIRWNMADRAHERRLFVSRADDVIVLAVRGWRPGDLRMDCRLRPYHVEGVTCFGSGRTPHWPKPPIAWSAEQGPDWHAHIGRYEDGREFGAVLQIVALGGGSVRADNYWGGPWSGVEGAEAALILVKCWHGEPASSAIPHLRAELSELPGDYDTLFARHCAVHEPLTRAFALDLGASETDRAKANDALAQEAFEGQASNALVERMVAHQRHLLIGSTRHGAWPANLQGKWNGDYAPAWQSDYHNNINVQMNYWPAPLTGLAGFIEPLADYYFQFLDDYRLNARRLFGCRGIFLPTMMATHGQVRHGDFVHWTAGAGWMAQHWWEHWLVTGDRQFLKNRTLPWLRETAWFYLDFVEIRDGVAHFSPSISPENHPPGFTLTVANAAMDVAICREVITHLLDALRVLDEHDPGESRYQELLAALPPYQTNAEGGLREWLHPALPDNQDHRHLSHLYGLFPGSEINEEECPDTFRLAARALELRQNSLGSMAGWSFSFMACTWARLGRGDAALQNLHLLLQSCTTPNLLTWHNDWRAQGLSLFWGHGALPPFQIEAGMGFVAAVCEMLAQSRPGFLHLLPALPSAWPEGRMRGLTTRCGVTVDLEWRNGGRSIKATLHSRDALRVTLRLPAGFEPERRTLELSPGPNIQEFCAS
jgi:alpha-L-fucosidase 2